MKTFKALPRGSKLVLVAGPLLFLSLFFTWQNLEIDYGRAGKAVTPQDGWDAWGLAIALLTITTVTIAVLRRLTEVKMPEGVSWDGVTLALGIVVFVFAALKSLRDADSSWASYGFIALAAVLAVGAYLDWADAKAGERRIVGRKRQDVRSAA